MLRLAWLLIREKQRRLMARYGLAGSVSLGVVMIGLALTAAVAAQRGLHEAPPAVVPALMNSVWVAWVMFGFVLGRDLTWQIRLERLKAFSPPGFARLYALGFLLSYLSFPLLIALIIFEGPASAAGFPRSLVLLPAFGLFAATVRLTASLARAIIFHVRRLPNRLLLVLSAFLLIATGFAAASFLRLDLAAALPGYQLGLILTGSRLFRPLLLLAVVMSPLMTADFLVQRHITYASLAGAPPSRNRSASLGSLLLLYPSWPSQPWRLALLGWLRNRNAALLLLWGSLYSFFWIWFSRPDDAFIFFLFSWMVLIFHAYLRGNLLGVDQAAVWIYYVLPAPAGKWLQAKNQTLTLLQGFMVLAVCLPGLIRRVPGMGAVEWLHVASYAWSMLLVGEIAGGFFSLRHADPIERDSQFSGGMTVGGLIVPALQLAFSGAFALAVGLTRPLLPPAAFVLELIAIPGVLCLARSLFLPGWMQRTMVAERESIMAKLTVFSS